MLILSQDKNKIINLDNVNTILANDVGRIVTFDNSYNSEDDCSDSLGKYATKERAKKVLQEIIEMYIDCNEQYFPSGLGYIKNKVYEMPKD